MKIALLCAALLSLVSCEWFGETREPAGPPVAPEVRERVVAEVLLRLGKAFEQEGARFHTLLPAIKEESAKASGFADWAAFRAGLEAAGPGLDVDISRRITARMNQLLAPSGE